MEESKDIITIEVYASENTETGLSEWESDAVVVTAIGCSLSFTLNELDILKESLSGIIPSAKNEWHELKLCRVYENRGWDEPPLDYYSLVGMCIISYRECQQCGKLLSAEEQKEMSKYGVEPFCSQYCMEVANGTPMPVSTGALVFDKFWNQNNQ